MNKNMTIAEAKNTLNNTDVLGITTRSPQGKLTGYSRILTPIEKTGDSEALKAALKCFNIGFIEEKEPEGTKIIISQESEWIKFRKAKGEVIKQYGPINVWRRPITSKNKTLLTV